MKFFKLLHADDFTNNRYGCAIPWFCPLCINNDTDSILFDQNSTNES